jgi:IclR family transcriptional regulator, pca regulon regulatory protein
MNAQVKSAARVLDVLELFAASPIALGVTEVARKLDIPKSSAQGLLTTLAGRGYLAREAATYFQPPELRDGGWAGGLRMRLLALAKPILENIAQESGESAFLGTLVGNKVQYLAKAVSGHEVRYDASLSQLRPVYCTSIGLAILAHRDPSFASAILNRTKITKITPNTVTDRETIDRMLDRARQLGFAEVKDANLLGASGVAAPVFGPRGEVLAGLSIGAPTSRYAVARKQLAKIVAAKAATLSRLLQVKIEKTTRAKSRSS